MNLWILATFALGIAAAVLGALLPAARHYCFPAAAFLIGYGIQHFATSPKPVPTPAPAPEGKVIPLELPTSETKGPTP